MTSAEFKKRRDALGAVIAQGLMYYAVWQKIAYRDPKTARWSLDELNAMLGRFKGFFSPVATVLLEAAYLQFANVFDEDPRTVSLRVLLNAAREDASLIPNGTLEDVRKIEEALAKDEALREQLKIRRDQYIAHADANPQPLVSQLKKEFDVFIGRIEDGFVELSEAHDGLPYVFDSVVSESAQATVAVVGALIDLTEKQS